MFIDAILGTGLLVAVATDLSSGKIPNGLTLPLAAAGLLLNGLSGQLGFALVGFAVAFAVHFGLWAFRVVKGGDAKLMIAVGALVGWQEMIEATFWMLLLLVPVGLVQLTVTGRLGNLARHFRWQLARARGGDPGPPPPVTKMVFAGVIAPAVLIARTTTWLELA